MKKSVLPFFLCALCFGVTIGTMLNCNPKSDVAYADGPEPIENDAALHSLTVAPSFNTETPAITFFTHGLGGSAKHWSNNFHGVNENLSFTQDSASIIERMRSTSASGINLYRITTTRVYPEYSLADVDSVTYSNSSPMMNLNFDKHVVIVPEISGTYRSMEEVYNDFEHIVDSVVNNYREVKHKIPSINLVGHSMGGLLNMQYTIDHPKNVASLVSLGTPYNGSWYDNPLVEMLGITDFNDQPCIAGTCAHEYYFCDLNHRRNAWNTMYASNPHINFYALAGETSNLLWQEMIFTGQLARYQSVGAEIGGAAVDLLSAFTAWWLLPGDICVDGDSQRATGFNGVNTMTKTFYPWNTNIDKRSTQQIPIPHNLETYDADLQRCVLGIIDYGNVNNNVYQENGMQVSLLAKVEDRYLVKIRNNTGIATAFEYNSKLCFESDAKNWTNLQDIETTTVVKFQSSIIVEIGENAAATHLTISYEKNGTRYVFYANNLNGSSLTLSSHSHSFNNPKYSSNYLEISILSKCDDYWFFKVKNNNNAEKELFYNEYMCFESDAKNWTNITNVSKTKPVAAGESIILKICQNAFATDATISFNDSGIRRIVYAHNLSTSRSMSVYSYSKSFNTYTKNGLKVALLGKNVDKWIVDVTNVTESDKYIEFNQKMCFEGDARNWANLTDIGITVKVKFNRTVTLMIEEYAFATDIAISYVAGNKRKIVYAHNLSASCSMTCYESEAPYSLYKKNNIEVGIIGKNGTTWKLRVRNCTGSETCFYYNKKMCFFSDAQNWTGLIDIERTDPIQSGDSTEIQIEEYGTATSIAISYLTTSQRKVFYASNLNINGSMSAYGKSINTTTYNTTSGISVRLLGKKGTEWSFELTNNTGNTRTFYYNQKMCFEDDAKQWSGLSHERSVSIQSGKTNSSIKIEENGTATDIAISYEVGDNRYVFYAHNLSASGTMTMKENTVNYKSYTKYGITVQLMYKKGTVWSFKLTNNTGSYRTFEYNSKLCFENDAKTWSNLSDKKTVNLSNGYYQWINIEESFFATDIAISYEDSNYRYVFYAHNLSTNHTMSAYENKIDKNASSGNCVAEGTMITLADGSQKPVEELSGNEMLLVWNFETGAYDSAPIMFIDSDPQGHYEVINLAFSDGTEVDVITEHGFFDKTLNKFIYLDENASHYIGHSFIKQDGASYKEVTLMDVTISTKVTRTYSPVTYSALCYYVNGMLSMPGGIDGLFNIFEVDGDTMKYNEESMTQDIETYGLLTYEELSQFVSVSETMFNGVNGQYLNIAMGKGLITQERIQQLAERYGSFVSDDFGEATSQPIYTSEYIRSYIINAFTLSGFSLRQYIEQYIRSYFRNYRMYIPSSVYNNAIWSSHYDAQYFYAFVKVNYCGVIFIFDIQVAY